MAGSTDGSKAARRGISGSEHPAWDGLVILAPGIIGAISIWRSNGAAAGLAFVSIIGAVALCVVAARRWGRWAQTIVLLIALAASTASLAVIVT